MQYIVCIDGRHKVVSEYNIDKYEGKILSRVFKNNDMLIINDYVKMYFEVYYDTTKDELTIVKTQYGDPISVSNEYVSKLCKKIINKMNYPTDELIDLISSINDYVVEITN